MTKTGLKKDFKKDQKEPRQKKMIHRLCPYKNNRIFAISKP